MNEALESHERERAARVDEVAKLRKVHSEKVRQVSLIILNLVEHGVAPQARLFPRDGW